MPTEPNPDVLLAAADKHLGLIAKYNPYRNFAGIKDRKAFAALIANDPAFCSFGFGDERYVVGRIGGNLITSLHRKIGDLYEEMFRYLLECRFDLSAADLSFKVVVEIGDRTQTRSTDELLPKECIAPLNLPQQRPLLNSSYYRGFIETLATAAFAEQNNLLDLKPRKLKESRENRLRVNLHP